MRSKMFCRDSMISLYQKGAVTERVVPLSRWGYPERASWARVGVGWEGGYHTLTLERENRFSTSRQEGEGYSRPRKPHE